VSTPEVRQKSRLPLALSIPKTEDSRNEDGFYRSAKGVYALSDGASVSFDSASWARILVRHYARNPEFTHEWLSGAIAEFASCTIAKACHGCSRHPTTGAVSPRCSAFALLTKED